MAKARRQNPAEQSTPLEDLLANEARDWVMEQRWLKDGCICPICEQLAKVYKRPAHSSMGIALLRIHRYFLENPAEGWLHVESYLKSDDSLPAAVRGDFPKLRFWRLIEREIGRRSDGSRRTGYYRITHRGIQFASRRAQIRKNAITYNDVVLRFNGPLVYIDEVLGNRFDYDEIMGEVEPVE